MIYMFTITVPFMLIFMNHPLSVGLMLLMQTVLISILSGSLIYNFWFSYIIFLIMVGGMMILFMYMTSVASNEKFKINTTILTSTITLSMIMTPSIWYMEMDIMENKFFNNSIISLSLNKFMNYPLNFFFMFIILYLFITLIATVKITQTKSGPLRQMHN